jgi:hypothetical protein
MDGCSYFRRIQLQREENGEREGKHGMNILVPILVQHCGTVTRTGWLLLTCMSCEQHERTIYYKDTD